MGLVEVSGVAVEDCVAAELAKEFKGVGIISCGSSARVAIASLGLEAGDKLVKVMAGGDTGVRYSDCARGEASFFTWWLGAWVLSWVGCLARSSSGRV